MELAYASVLSPKLYNPTFCQEGPRYWSFQRSVSKNLRNHIIYTSLRLGAKRTLHTAISLHTLLAESYAATPHVTNLGCRARRARTVRTLDAALALQGVESANQADVLLHSLGHGVPERSVQRCVRRPFSRRTISRARAVLEFESGSRAVQLRERRDVRVESVRIVDVEAASVDLVQPETGVEVRERRDTGAYPTGRERIRSRLSGTVVGVVDHELVFVCVAEEDVGDNVRAVALDDLVEEVGWVWERVAAVPAREDVTCIAVIG